MSKFIFALVALFLSLNVCFAYAQDNNPPRTSGDGDAMLQEMGRSTPSPVIKLQPVTGADMSAPAQDNDYPPSVFEGSAESLLVPAASVVVFLLVVTFAINARKKRGENR